MRIPEFRAHLKLAAERLDYPAGEAYVHQNVDPQFHDLMFRSLYPELPHHYAQQDVESIKKFLDSLPATEPVPHFNEIVTYWTRRIWAKSHG